MAHVLPRYLLLTLTLLLSVVQSITPKQLIEAPRYGPALPNRNGDFAIFFASRYSFEELNWFTTWYSIDLATSAVRLLPFGGDVAEMVWSGSTPTSVLYINRTNLETPGGISLWLADIARPHAQSILAADLPAPFEGLKATTTRDGDVKFVMHCLAYANNGSAYNKHLTPRSFLTGRLYDSIYIRFLSTYVEKERYAVFSGTLAKSGNSTGTRFSNSSESGYALSGPVKNLLEGMEYNVTRPESPIANGDFSISDYDISPDGSLVSFVSKAPQLPKNNYTAAYIYLVPQDGSSVARAVNGPGSDAPAAAQGWSSAPRFSPNSMMIAYWQEDGVAYESDLHKMYVYHIESNKIQPVAANWDYWAQSLDWSPDGTKLYVGSDYHGGTRLFIFPLDAKPDYKPKNLTDDTEAWQVHSLPNGNALITAWADWSSILYYSVTPEGNKTYHYKANENDTELAGLGPQDVGHFWYEGALGDLQQAHVIYPTGFSSNKTYPLLFFIDGGPQDYFGNRWSITLNSRSFADQGYVVVGPNPTGSTSFGQALTDRVQNQWGGLPYEDLVKAHKQTCENFPYIDCKNAVAVGASYGCTMINWIQGHDLGREFKALVCHNGYASTLDTYNTDELWFIQHDFNGTLWDKRPNYERWDSLSHAINFSTPEFISVGEMDYRVPATEGITMFNVLQSRGVPSRLFDFSDETHFIRNPHNSLAWYTEVFNWINYWSGKISSLDDQAIDM